MGTTVVDASLILGLLDPRDAHHHGATRAWRQLRERKERIVLPASALAEVLVGTNQLGAEAARTTEAFVDSVVDAVSDIDRSVARSAASYRARYPAIRLPDALVIAVGSVLNADTILTADARWARVDRRVRVIR